MSKAFGSNREKPVALAFPAWGSNRAKPEPQEPQAPAATVATGGSLKPVEAQLGEDMAKHSGKGKSGKGKS